MRIATLNANLFGVGTYQRCFYFSRELARAGHDVTMMTVSATSRYRPNVYYRRGWLQTALRPDGDGPWVRMIEGPNVGYRWLPGWGSGPLDIAGRIAELNRGRYDVVYAFEYQPNVSWPVSLTHSSRGYRLLSDWCDWYAGHANTFRGIEIAHRVDGYFEERIRLAAEKVSVISQCLGDRARSLGIPATQVVHIRQGVDLDYIEEHSVAQARRRLGLAVNRPLVGWVKDASEEFALRLIGCVRTQLPDAQLLAIGNVRAESRRLAAELGVDDGVIWAGRVSDVDYPWWLAAADVLVLPLSDDLGNRARFPGKLLDYLAAARPVITNDVGEVGQLFRDRTVGVLAGPREQELASAIVGLLSDSSRRQNLGRSARQVMEREWDWQLRGKQIEAMLV